MDQSKIENFRQTLVEQLRLRTANVRSKQERALEYGAADDGPKDSVDMSLQDVNQELALRLGERESRMVADIDQALLRIEEGSYGTCARCDKEIPLARLDALPTARHCAPCQELIEAGDGDDEHSTL
jgi:DnaK suppressor protein